MISNTHARYICKRTEHKASTENLAYNINKFLYRPNIYQVMSG